MVYRLEGSCLRGDSGLEAVVTILAMAGVRLTPLVLMKLMSSFKVVVLPLLVGEGWFSLAGNPSGILCMAVILILKLTNFN